MRERIDPSLFVTLMSAGSYCLDLRPPSGSTLHSHLGLWGQWSYLRIADVVAFLSVTLLLTFAAHYVDDFFSVEQAWSAESSFATFQAFHRLLGFRMKEAKSQTSSHNTDSPGHWCFDHDHVRAGPGPARVVRLISAIQSFLDADEMSASECSSLAGRLCFTCTWVFGHVGRSFLQPLYFRQHHGNPGHSKLTPRVRQALTQLQRLLRQVRPMRFPLRVAERSSKVAHQCADAFITLHGVRRSARRWLHDNPPIQELRTSTNGFGAVFSGPGVRPVRWPFEARYQHSC